MPHTVYRDATKRARDRRSHGHQPIIACSTKEYQWWGGARSVEAWMMDGASQCLRAHKPETQNFFSSIIPGFIGKLGSIGAKIIEFQT